MPQSEIERLTERNKLIDRNIEIEKQLGSSKEFMPEFERKPVSFEDAGIEQDEIKFVEDVNKRELNQLQGKTTPYDPYNVSMQSMAETATKTFGGDTLSGNFVSPWEKLKATSIKRRINAAESGISTGGGVSWGAQAVASLALTDQDKAKSSQSYLNEKFGKEVKIGRDKQSGEMVYFDPKEKKLYPLNRLGMDSGDFAAAVGPVIVGGFEAAGAIIGAVQGSKKKATRFFKQRALTTRQQKEIVYAGSGAALGEFIRLTLGQSFGVNEDLSLSDKVLEAAKEAGLSVGTGAVFEGMLGLVKKLRAGLGDAVIPGAVLRQLTESFENIDFSKVNSGELAVKAINEALYESGSKDILQPNLAQFQNNTQLLDVVAGLKTPGSEEKKILVETEMKNEAAQQQYFQLINNDVTTAPAVGASQVGEDIQGVTNKTIEQQTKLANEPLIQAKKLEQQQFNELDTSKSYKAAQELKAALTKEEQIFVKAAKEDYMQLGLDADAVEAIPDSFNMKLKLAALAQKKGAAKQESFLSYLDDDALDTNKNWTVTDIGETIKTLRLTLRQKKNEISPITGKIRKAISILEEYRVKALKDDPDLALRLKQLDAAYADGKTIFNEGVTREILKNREALPNSQIFNRIIVKGDSTTSQNVAAGIMGNPEAELTMKQAINKFYKGKVRKGGVFSLTEHLDFVDKYIDSKIITPFFKKSELNQIKKAGGIGHLVDLKTKQRDAALERVNDLFETKIQTLESKQLLNKFWGEEKQKNVRKLKTALEKNPEIWASVQSEVLRDIELKVMPKGVFNVTALNNLINKNGGTIKEMFGEGYLNNLTFLKDSLDITGRKGEAVTVNAASAIMDLTRAYVGVFTTPGRFVTAANRLRSATAKKLIAEMILDPNKLRKLHALSNARSGSRTAALLFAELGASELAITGDPDDKVYKRSISDQIRFIKKQKNEAEQRKKLINKKEKDQKILELKEQQQKFLEYTR